MQLHVWFALFRDARGKMSDRRVRLLLLALCLLSCGLFVPTIAHAALAPNVPTHTSTPMQALQLRDLTMINQSTGWALSEDTLPHVYVTHHGPEHWSDVTPSQLTSDPNTELTASSFPDATRGYLGILQNGNVFLLSTLNSGKTWQTTQLTVLAGLTLNQIFFLDAQHGWLNFGVQITLAGDSVLVLTHTSDGGKTWQTLLESDKGASGLQAGSFQSTHFTFNDSQNGWATAFAPTGSVYLYRTSDGGKTWSNVTVMPIKGNGVSVATSYGPYWLNSTSGTLYVQYDLDEGFGNRALTAFQTYDGGRTWVLGPSTVGTTFNDLYSSSFLNARQGWSFGFNDQGQYVIHHTSTGGRPWELIHPTGLLKPDALNQAIGNLSFLNAMTGWILIKDAQNIQHLFQTNDGGHTWYALHPILG